MSNVPEGAQLSEDGNYYWDGEQWQPVEGGAAAAGAAAGGEAGEVTAADLEPVGDLQNDPGDESKVTEKTKPYFTREGEPAEGGQDLDAVIDTSNMGGGGGDSSSSSSSDSTEGSSDNG